MGEKRLPRLADTDRRYVDDTRRARLASPGIERFPRRRGPGRAGGLAVALFALAALLAALLWMARVL